MHLVALTARRKRIFSSKGIVLVRTRQQITHLRFARPYPIAITALVLILAIVLPSRVWTVLLSGMLTIVSLSFLWALLTGRGVDVERSLLHTWVQVGDLLEEAITLHNNSRVPIIAAEVEDLSDIPGYA